MKKFLTSISLALVLAVAPGCNKDNPTDDPVDPVKIDHVIMYYTVGGGNLDVAQIKDLLYTYEVISDNNITNVAVSAFFKPSPTYYEDYPGILHFTTDVNRMSSLTAADVEDISFETLKKVTDVTLLDNADVVFNTSAYLSKCIGIMKKEYPDAANYTLVVSNHGGAYSYMDEIWSEDEDTKAIGYGDKSSDGKSYPPLGASTLLRGVNKGGVDFCTLVTDACIMATQENIAEYRKAFQYAMLSAEVTTGDIMQHIVKNLAKTGSDLSGLRSAYQNVVDAYVAANEGENVTSFGFYDLSKAEAAEDIVAEFVQIAIDLNENVLGESALARAVNDCLCNSAADDDEGLELWQEVRKALDDGEITEQTIDDMIELEGKSTSQFQVYDFMVKYCAAYEDDEDFTLKHNPDTLTKLEGLRDSYLKAVKDMAYINCTKSNTGYDNPYLHTSVSTNLYSLDKDAFVPWSYEHPLNGSAIVSSLISGGDLPENYTDEQLEYYRQIFIDFASSSDFSQKTQWAELLQISETNPSVFYNPSRSYGVKK